MRGGGGGGLREDTVKKMSGDSLAGVDWGVRFLTETSLFPGK